MMRSAALLFCTVVVAAGSAQAAQKTRLVPGADAYAVRYSQAATFTFQLVLDADDSPVDGAACTGPGDVTPCDVSVFVERDDDPATADVDEAESFLVGQPFVDAEGGITLRLPIVDDQNRTFTTSPDGEPWRVRVVFASFGNPSADECAADTPDVDDGDLCESAATVPLTLSSEVLNLRVTPGIEVSVGGTLDLSATLTDASGDAVPGGEDIDGPGIKPIAGATVAFFFDLNQNGRPDGNENLGTGVTNDSGVAGFSFFADPAFVEAGTYDAGIHAVYGGDSRYALASSNARLIVRAGAAVVAETILEATPGPPYVADGVTLVTLRARLVDAAGNLLDETTPDNNVRFTTDYGTLVEEAAERDLLNGSYTQELRPLRANGQARIVVFVDDVEGPSIDLDFTGGSDGCTCSAGSETAAPAAAIPGAAACLAALLVLRRRRR